MQGLYNVSKFQYRDAKFSLKVQYVKSIFQLIVFVLHHTTLLLRFTLTSVKMFSIVSYRCNM